MLRAFDRLETDRDPVKKFARCLAAMDDPLAGLRDEGWLVADPLEFSGLKQAV